MKVLLLKNTCVIMLGFYFLGTVTQTPSFACVGESITVSCVLTPLNTGDTFYSVVPNFIVGDSDTVLTASEINTNIAHPGVDLSRLTASAPTGTTTRVSGEITLSSYLTSDRGLRLGCSINYGSGDDILDPIAKEFTETLRLTQAGMHVPFHR